ncbi:MAG: hypothetical protein KAT74_01115 [Candidatus Cloacimonetes bacterium]|jgi:hypothetical protein|nr:hypothetical protein [Candidatus Cloacimonadota bacterium]
MKSQKIKILIIYTIVFLISGCAIFPKLDQSKKEELLVEQLIKWETFRIDGIIEANYKNFSFRKNITIRKNKEALRADIYDAGIMGLHPTPFFSAYLDSILISRIPDQHEFIEISKHELIKKFPYMNYLINLQTLYNYKDEIIRNNKVTIDSLEFNFSKYMLIENIKHLNKQYKMEFEYFKEPSKIIFFSYKKEIANIQIDKISYKYIEIQILD